RGSAVAEAVVRGRDASPSEDDLQDPKYHLGHHADRGSAEPLIEPADDDLVVVVVRLDPVSESTIRLTDLRYILEFTIEEDASPVALTPRKDAASAEAARIVPVRARSSSRTRS